MEIYWSPVEMPLLLVSSALDSPRNRYIGIWYKNVPEQTVVWVTNRDNPINGTSGVLVIDPSGNLVLSDESHNRSVCAWQSFDYPTNTILPNMKAGWNRRTGLNSFMTSWKAHDDPGTSESVYKLELNGTPQFFLFKGSDSYVENDDEVTITYVMKDPSIFSRLVLNESGTLEWLTGQGPERGWARCWYAPSDQWFETQLERQWYLREASHVCKRKQKENVCGNGDGFIKVTNAKVPDTSIARVNKKLGLTASQELCLKNCSCTAFAIANISEGGNGCMTWHGNLVDIRQFSNNGQDLYIRVSAAELAQNRRNSKGFHGKILATTVVASIVGMLLILFLECCRGKEMDGSGTNAEVSVFDVTTIVSATDDFSQSNKLGEGGFSAVYKVWGLWREERALDIVDSSLDISYEVNKVLRCIHVGLLCVQEFAPDRPTMSEVAFMLCNETRLPYPKQAAYIFNSASTTPYTKSASAEKRSVNDMSITMVEAR
ncbi:S-locus lectin protein kinase family protein [Abeliophyllum distichum]|uniref:S-locus lectin protein kinase family protein n=1 Tax=Abeliophyllum distichum TaxID=126358 RepID=A0ABD1QGY7_9LAMI